MPKSPKQKLKLLYLAKILQEQTDEAHPMTVQELIAALQQLDIAAERKSVYDDLAALQQFGLDIVVTRRQANSYYIGERTFQLPELKLLVDAVQASKFITAKKSRELIEKLGSLASMQDAQLLQRQVYFSGRDKTMNETIYYSVDKIHSAISQNCKIEFKYYEWVVDSASPRLFEKSWRQGGKPYRVSPWALVWDSEYYYLVAYDSAAAILKHYRVDKMEAVTLLADARDGRALFEKEDLAAYTRRTFGMFGGEETDVKIRFANRLINVVVDRFGKDIRIQRVDAAHFNVTLRVVVSAPFIAWLLSFGNEAEVLAPAHLLGEINATLAALEKVYPKRAE